ncbi:hypothetical protein ACFCY8_10335 [Streptomyces noursei]
MPVIMASAQLQTAAEEDDRPHYPIIEEALRRVQTSRNGVTW